MSLVFTRPELELPRRGTGSPSEGTHEFVKATTVIIGYDDTCDFRVPAGSMTAEVQYNAAFTYMALIGGGEVRGSHGRFIVTASVTPITEVILSGVGETTVFTVPDGFDDNISIIYADSVDDVTLKDFKIDGNGTEQIAGTMHGVHPFDCERWIIENILVDDMYGGGGIRLDGTATYDAFHLVSNCTVENCDGTGIQFRYTSKSSAIGCLSSGNIVGYSNTPVGYWVNFVSCIAESNTNNGFALYGYASITSCTSNSNGWNGYAIISGGEVSLVGNLAWYNTWSGIYSDRSKNAIIGNNCNGNVHHGIHINDGNDNQIIGNICTDNGGDGAFLYDGIFLDGTADDNMILCNTVTNTSPTYSQRYGVNISAATCNRNIVFFNIYGDGNRIGRINDAGTNTGLPSRTFQFTEPIGTAVWVTASPTGIEVNVADEGALAEGWVPYGTQQVVRFRVAGVALAAPGAGNQMRLAITINAGKPEGHEAYNAEPIAVANKNNTEENPSINDAVEWVIDITDDVDIADITYGETFECFAMYEVAGDSDIATNALIRTVTAQYV